MSTFRKITDHVKLQLREKHHITAWNMAPEEAVSFIRSLQKTVLTFFGYSGLKYEDEKAMLNAAQDVLSKYSPETTLVNIGATNVGIGAIYPLAKSMGFTTTGIASVKALNYPENISDAVDYVCFIPDDQWGGKLPNSDELSPTSKTMVACSDILVGIGGGDISVDEMLAGKVQGKQVLYIPADMNHERAIQQAEKKGLPPPESFKGSAHDTFIGIKKSALKDALNKSKQT